MRADFVSTIALGRRLGVPEKEQRREGARLRSFYTACAAFSLASAIAGWLFVVSTWGFSSLAGPFGLVAAIPGLRSPRRIVALLGLVLNALLTALAVPWWMGFYG
jgi:hypothetical protein